MSTRNIDALKSPNLIQLNGVIREGCFAVHTCKE